MSDVCEHSYHTMPASDRYVELPLYCPLCMKSVQWHDGTVMTTDEWNAHMDETGRLLPGVEHPSRHNPSWVGHKLESLVDRLVRKMQMSQTPVPGFIMGLSGTDSIIAFLIAYKAAKRLNMAHRVFGVHYADLRRTKPTWFEDKVIPWLRANCLEATILVTTPWGGNQDQQRWADLHLRATHDLVEGKVFPLGEGENYWVCGTTNATEKALGKYSMLSAAVSIQLVQTLSKSTIMSLCETYDVPDIALEMAQIPDCLCGRDEFAAENIELIDDLLANRVAGQGYTLEQIERGMDYIATAKKEHDFKTRTPYTL